MASHAIADCGASWWRVLAPLATRQRAVALVRASFGNGNGLSRKIGIVALARKLLNALWNYLEHGELPAGAASNQQDLELLTKGDGALEF
jgi:hypothetical protein